MTPHALSISLDISSRSHCHRPHVHAPCSIDLTVKHAAVGGALTIVSRDIAAHKAGGEALSEAALADGTRYEALAGDEGRAAAEELSMERSSKAAAASISMSKRVCTSGPAPGEVAVS